MIPDFQPVDPENWARKPYFDYYNNQVQCKYTLTANIDITSLLPQIKQAGFRFFPVFLYIVMRAVNANREFRMGYDEQGRLGYWNFVVPSYTIFHDDDQTFSDIWSNYDECFAVFHETVMRDMITYRDVKGIKARSGRPGNFCPVSSIPWLHFTGFAQDTWTPSSMLFPIIRFGRYAEEHGNIRIPVAVYVNHAVADGYHTSRLFQDMQDRAAQYSDWLA